MHFASEICQNVLSHGILFFVLGIIAGFYSPEIKLQSFGKYIALYLMIAIGFKGGVAISSVHDLNSVIINAVIAGVLVSFLQPFLSYWILRKTTTLDIHTSAAIAAHYGSISVATFANAAAFLDSISIKYEGYIVAILALMEAPAIITALIIARHDNTRIKRISINTIKHIFKSEPIILLLGSFCIGAITGEHNFAKMEAFFITPFYGVLSLFLLDMGILISQNLNQIRQFSLSLIMFGIYMPLLGGAIGAVIARLIGLDIGTSTLFSTLCASASYIAVPAAMQTTLPSAKSAIYLPLSLAITFPFNITFGLSIYHYFNLLLI